MKKSLASISERMRQIAERLRQAISQPRDELDRWQRAARFLYDLGLTGLRQLRYDRAPQMAGELAFRTLFGLLPVMVVATVLVKALGMEQWFIEPLSNLLTAAGLGDVHVASTPEGTQSESLNAWLQENFVEATRLNLATIGWVGFLVTAYAAIGLIVTVENSFNTIYRVQRGRPWARRVPLYWFMLTVSPLVLVSGTYLNTRLQSMMTGIEVSSWVSSGASLAWTLFILWFILALFYSLMPNTNVHLRPAMAGAFVAAILVEVGKRTFGVFLGNALSISQLYGSLGLVPLFMFWVYLMWLVILFGLEVSAILQTVQGRRFLPHAPQVGAYVVEPSAIVQLMEHIARDFQDGQGSDVNDVIDDMGLPEQLINVIIRELTDEGYLHSLAGEKQAVTLAKPPENVSAEALMDIGFSMIDIQRNSRYDLADRLRDAQRKLLSNESLASLVAASPSRATR